MGRKRRSSNSTVATLDEDRIKYVEETSVLKLPSLDESDWDKTYVLEDVTIYGEDGQMADLLYVSFLGPVTVRGFIRAEGNQANRCMRFFFSFHFHSVFSDTQRVRIPYR